MKYSRVKSMILCFLECSEVKVKNFQNNNTSIKKFEIEKCN